MAFADVVRIIHAVDPIVTVHVVAAVALVAASLLAGAWGLARARRLGADASPREARAFAHALQLSHTLVLATGLLGLVLFASGNDVRDPLHARVYGPFMVVAIVAAYGYRTSDAARNVRVFAVAGLVIAALGIRAFFTG